MKTLILHIPENVELDEWEAMAVLAANLYKSGKLSLGQAAEFAGYSKRTFMELLGDFDVSFFNYSEAELDNDILHAQNYHI